MITPKQEENLRELYRKGYTITDIAGKFGLSRNTVKRLLQEHHGSTHKLDPYKEYVQARLEQAPLLSEVHLFEEIRARGYTGQISILKDFLGSLKAQFYHDLTVCFETTPGKQGQVDWDCFGTLTDEDTTCWLYGFVFLLCYSRAMYVEFTNSKDIELLLRCHLHAFDYLGGYPREILYDNNIKRNVLVQDYESHEYRWNPKLLDFAGYYGFLPRLGRPYRARTKGRPERITDYVKTNFFNGCTFSTLEDLNQQALVWCDTVVNRSIHAIIGKVPFEQLKRELLLSHRRWPPYDTSEVVVRQVSWDGYVSFYGNFYAVPHPYRGKTITVRATPDGMLEFWDKGRYIGSFRRLKKRGQVISDSSNLV